MEVESPDSHHPALKIADEQDQLLIPNGSAANNGIFEESHFDESSTHSSEMIPAAEIKAEPIDSLEDSLDCQKGRFNLRKRKNSFSSIDSTNGKEIDLPINQEEGEKKRMRRKFVYNYTTSQLQEALDLVHSENISILTAAKQYGIPRSTLRRYALTVWAAAAPKSRSKQEPALTPPEEAHIVSMISKMSRAGKYVSTMDVKSTVQNLLDESQRVVFKDRNRPTAGWVQRFRKRHKNLPLKGSGYTVKKPGPASKQDVNEWYSEISDYLVKDWEVCVEEIFSEKNVNRIYNLDEMTVPLNCKQDLMEESIGLGHKNDEFLNEVTVLTAVSAAGEFMQPLIIQKGEGGGHDDDIMPLDQNSYGISFSISGKLNYEIFIRWLEAFDRELCEKDIPKPIIIFLDDVFAHFHISVFTYAIDNDIILLCLQSPTLQPIYSAVSEQVKNSYREFCKEHYRLSGTPVSMDLFPETFLRAWETVKDGVGVKENIIDSFHYYGLLPFTPCADAYNDLPDVLEEPSKNSQKSEKSSKFPKEPKAKKTVSSKLPSDESQSSLIAAVKMKKLEQDPSSPTLLPSEDGCVGESSSINSSNEVIGQNYLSYPMSPQESKLKQTLLKAPQLSKAPRSNRSSLASQVANLSHERILGRQDGIRKCLELMESFIPSDVISVWRNRTSEIKVSSEIPYCMWKTVNNLFHDMTTEADRRAKTVKLMQSKPVTKQAKKKLQQEEFINTLDYLQCEQYEL